MSNKDYSLASTLSPPDVLEQVLCNHHQSFNCLSGSTVFKSISTQVCLEIPRTIDKRGRRLIYGNNGKSNYLLYLEELLMREEACC